MTEVSVEITTKGEYSPVDKGLIRRYVVMVRFSGFIELSPNSVRAGFAE